MIEVVVKRSEAIGRCREAEDCRVALGDIYHRGCASLTKQRDRLITGVCQAHVHVSSATTPNYLLCSSPSARTRIPETNAGLSDLWYSGSADLPIRPSYDHGQLFQPKRLITAASAAGFIIIKHVASHYSIPRFVETYDRITRLLPFSEICSQAVLLTYSSLFTSFACDGGEGTDKSLFYSLFRMIDNGNSKWKLISTITFFTSYHWDRN